MAPSTTNRTILSKFPTGKTTRKSRRTTQNTLSTLTILTPTVQKSQLNLPVLVYLLRVWRAGATDSTLAVGLSHHWGSEPLSQRRAFCYSLRRIDHHFRRTLLHRQNLRLCLSQRYLHFRRKRKQIHQTQNLRHTACSQVRSFCCSCRFQDHHFRRKRSQRQNI